MKILVRTPNWLGDAIMAVPAVTGLTNKKNLEISILTKQSLCPIWSRVKKINHIIGFNDRWSPYLMLKQYKYDKAVLLTNSFESALHLFCNHIPMRRGTVMHGRSFLLTDKISVDKQTKQYHQIDFYASIVGTEHGQIPRIQELNNSSDNAKAFLNNFGWKGESIVCIHPMSSYGPAKNWLLSSYIELCNKLWESFKLRPVIIGTEAERNKLKNAFKENYIINIAGKTDLNMLIDIMAAADIFIGNDSGPLHLAAALDKPAIGIYGSTDPVRTGPRGENVRILKKDIDCSPCLSRRCMKRDMQCMKMINVDDVINAVSDFFAFERGA